MEFMVKDIVFHKQWGIGEIISTGGYPPFLVEFIKEYPFLHDGNDFGECSGKNHHCWWCNNDELILLIRKKSTT